MKVEFLTHPPQEGVLFLPLGEDLKLQGATAAWDVETGGALQNALKHARFKGKIGDFLPATHAAHAGPLVLTGTGEPAHTWTAHDFARLGAAMTREMDHFSVARASFAFLRPETPLTDSEAAAHLAYGALLKSWRFDTYFTQETSERPAALQQFSVVVANAPLATQIFKDLEKVAEGVFFTRNVVSEPGNVMYPEALATRFEELRALGVKVDVLGEPEMRALGMNALLGVAQGSAFGPRLVVMRWNGAPDPALKPVAFVGKGVTFDTGGISIKPADGMWEMKGDMAGAGVVGGLMKALAGRKAPVHVVGVVGLVENMPSGTAQRPGDVITSMAGLTIEMLDSDAEGRLVLADAVTYAQQQFAPEIVMDLATLTGAIIAALGTEYAGLFSNDDDLAQSLAKAGEAVGEKLWRMPMHKNYDATIESKTADIQNIENTRGAGSISAAKFIERFIQPGVKWAHLDIAGVDYFGHDSDLQRPGATAFGVRLLEQWIRENLEG